MQEEQDICRSKEMKANIMEIFFTFVGAIFVWVFKNLMEFLVNIYNGIIKFPVEHINYLIFRLMAQNMFFRLILILAASLE